MTTESGGPATGHLAECLELAARARGSASPNPLVGAVVAAGERVLGRGYHRRCGEPHAERLALAEAGTEARGATLYTNMEPCCHEGRTPPCTDAIVEAGIARVVACHADPDDRVAGRGFETLRRAGVDVDHGLLAAEAAELNAGYLRFKQHGLPLVTAKAALSLDGRMATRSGDSQWITGPEARAYGHRLRSESDAVAVGIETLLADDPRLTAREAATGGPRYRVVFDSTLRTPPGARLLQESEGEPIVLCGGSAPAAARESLEQAGARVVQVETTPEGRVALEPALRALADMGVLNLLIEGGGALLTSALDAGMIDRVVFFYAPLLIGGGDAPSPWAGLGSEMLAAAPRLCRVRHHRLGDDWAVEGYLREPVPPAL